MANSVDKAMLIAYLRARIEMGYPFADSGESALTKVLRRVEEGDFDEFE